MFVMQVILINKHHLACIIIMSILTHTCHVYDELKFLLIDSFLFSLFFMFIMIFFVFCSEIYVFHLFSNSIFDTRVNGCYLYYWKNSCVAWFVLNVIIVILIRISIVFSLIGEVCVAEVSIDNNNLSIKEIKSVAHHFNSLDLE